MRISASGKLLFATAFLVAVAGPVQSKPQPPRTLSFVITNWEVAVLETKFLDECPEGFTMGNDEIWIRSMTKAQKAKVLENGRSERYFTSLHRGPKGENVCLNPTVVNDPPLNVVEGPTAYGMNLDGTSDGAATPKTCKHQKFTGVDGTPSVDNQLYRVLGCIYGWHFYGMIQQNANANRRTTAFGINIIEVSDVDDSRNDPDVTVQIHHAIDQYALDGTGRFTPFSSYRIEMRDGKSAYGRPVKGKIVDGVLTTEPADTVLPFYGNYTFIDERFRDFRLRLAISPDGKTAKGMTAGYYDVDQLIYYVGSIGQVAYSTQSNCPGIYAAAHRLADGYPDPTTGECTALSSAHNFDAVAAFAVYPESAAPPSAQTGLSRFLAMLGMEH